MRVALSMVFLLACSSNGNTGADSGSDAGGVTGDFDPVPFGGTRPVSLYVPSAYTGAPLPLVILLHGYTASGAVEDLYLNMKATAEAKGVFYMHPDGTIDSGGKRFWNASDACCDFGKTGVDDSSYLAGLVAEVETRYAIDTKRVYFVGHSNGGFMSYRMACDHADIVTGIMSLAGAMPLDVSLCKPKNAVTVLEVHGTADTTIAYDGGSTAGINSAGGTYPSAPTSVADWATFDGCATPADTSQPPLDIEASLAGSETSVTEYKAGCAAGNQVDLWSINGAGHIPGFNASFVPAVFDFLLAHSK